MPTDLFSFHPAGSRFRKRDIISEAAAQYVWSKQNGMENSSHSDLLPPSPPPPPRHHPSMPWRLGTQREQWHPSGPPAPAAVRWGTGTGAMPRATQGRCGLRPPGSATLPTLPDFWKLLFPLIRKAILLLAEIWFDIYIH